MTYSTIRIPLVRETYNFIEAAFHVSIVVKLNQLDQQLILYLLLTVLFKFIKV
jgi:hypothetical protein